MMADDVIATLVSLDMITELNSRFVSLAIVYTHTNTTILWPVAPWFCYSARSARIASAVLATAIPSVCPSVRHTPVLCQNDGT